MSNVINKVRLLSDRVTDVNDNFCIAKFGDTFKVVTDKGIDSTSYVGFSILNDKDAVLNTDASYEPKYVSLYKNGEFIKELTHNEFVLYVKDEVLKDIASMKFRMHNTDYCPTYVRKVRVGPKFTEVVITTSMRSCKVILNSEGKEICSFENEYETLLSRDHITDCIVCHKKKINPKFREMLTVLGRMDNHIEEEAERKFGSSEYVLLNKNGEVISASNKPIRACDKDKFTCNDKIYKISGNTIKEIMDCDDYNSEILTVFGYGAVAMQDINDGTKRLYYSKLDKIWEFESIGHCSSRNYSFVFIINGESRTALNIRTGVYTELPEDMDIEQLYKNSMIVEFEDRLGNKFSIDSADIRWFR